MFVSDDLETVFLDTVDSTNSYLLSRAGRLTAFQSVATTNQTNGRGRLDRSWVSSPGLGIAMSIALPPTPKNRSGGFEPLLVGSAVLDALRHLGVRGAQMKWPNDIIVGQRKLAGILCEVSPLSPFVVAGIGINTYYNSQQLPHPSATSLALEGLMIKEWKSLVEVVLRRVRAKWADIPQLLDNWDEHWERRLATIGRQVMVDDGYSPVWSGTAIGVDRVGRLLVRADEFGETLTLSAGDITHLSH